MAVSTFQATTRDPALADRRSDVTAAGTDLLLTGAGKLSGVFISAVGTAGTLDIYDHASANTNPIYRWVTADGKVQHQLNIPVQNGLRVVTTATSLPEIHIVWR